jgi:hypothetical protein
MTTMTSDDQVYCAACEEFERTGHTNAKHSPLCPHAAPWVDKTRHVMPAFDRKGIVAELTGGKPGIHDSVLVEIENVSAPPEDAERMGSARVGSAFGIVPPLTESSAAPPDAVSMAERAFRSSAPRVVTRLLAPNMPTRTREYDQPLPTANDYPAIQNLVIADMEARKQIGIERYGQLLKPFDGRDPLKDLYDELLDGANYVRKLMFERDGK